MDAQAIEQYLAELGAELEARGIEKPIRIMLIGGAFMLVLAKAPRPTNDIDIYWLDEDAYARTFNPLRESVQAVMNKHALTPNWFNFTSQMLHYDEMFIPNGKLWKQFGPLHIYAPSNEYILALKIKAGRDKDLEDCDILLPKTKIRTLQQAKQLVERYITPKGQQENAEQIANALDYLFREK